MLVYQKGNVFDAFIDRVGKGESTSSEVHIQCRCIDTSIDEEMRIKIRYKVTKL